jgi:hypothetical protein
MSTLKLPATTARAASLALTGSLVTVVGTASGDNANATTGAISLLALSSLVVQCTYARNAGSTTGRPIFAVDISLDSPDTAAASVANFFPVALLDSATFSSGRIDGYAYQFSLAPSETGTTTPGTPPFNVASAPWARIRMADVDGATPGTVTSIRFGGEASP